MTPSQQRDEGSAGEMRGEATMGGDRAMNNDRVVGEGEPAGREDGGDGWFVSAAAAVGDLENPFYDEERRRDVWNEASAVGFQLMLILGLAATAGFLWFGGAAALPYAQVMSGVIGLASIVTIAYAQRLGVNPVETIRVTWWRMVPVMALVVLIAIGMVRASSWDSDTLWGMITGIGVVVAISAGVALRGRHRERRRAEAAED